MSGDGAATNFTLTARKAQTMGAMGWVRHTGSSEGLLGDRRSFYGICLGENSDRDIK